MLVSGLSSAVRKGKARNQTRCPDAQMARRHGQTNELRSSRTSRTEQGRQFVQGGHNDEMCAMFFYATWYHTIYLSIYFIFGYILLKWLKLKEANVVAKGSSQNNCGVPEMGPSEVESKLSASTQPARFKNNQTKNAKSEATTRATTRIGKT